VSKSTLDILSDLGRLGFTEFRVTRPGRLDSLQVRVEGDWLNYYYSGGCSARPILWSRLRDYGYTLQDLKAVSAVLFCAAESQP
jgi:hypothetical protein